MFAEAVDRTGRFGTKNMSQYFLAKWRYTICILVFFLYRNNKKSSKMKPHVSNAKM